MKRVIGFLAKLYPSRWRQRYGTEFDALLEDAQPNVNTAFNVFSGAISMQIRTWSLVKIVSIAGLVGVLLAMGIVLTLPKRYAARSVLKFSASLPLHDFAVEIDNMSKGIRDWHSLTQIITNRGLYPTERAKMPMAEITDKMNKNILITPAGRDMFAIQFEYSDPDSAQKVTNDLVRAVIESNLNPRIVSTDGTNISALRPTLQVLDSAKRPERPLSPNSTAFVVIGLAGGLVCATLAFFVRRTRTRAA